MEDDKIVIPSNVTLEIVEGPDAGTLHEIEEKSIAIGREGASGLSLKDQYVSSKQCQVVFRNDHFTVIDLGSLNKTKVNDKVYVQKILRDQDVISIGKTKIKFNWSEQDVTTIQEEDVLGDDNE